MERSRRQLTSHRVAAAGLLYILEGKLITQAAPALVRRHCQLKQGWYPPAVGGAAFGAEKSLARL